MKILRQKEGKHGTLIVTVEIKATENLIAIDPDLHYELGEPLQGDVLAGHIIADASLAHWCSIEQKWIT